MTNLFSAFLKAVSYSGMGSAISSRSSSKVSACLIDLLSIPMDGNVRMYRTFCHKGNSQI